MNNQGKDSAANFSDEQMIGEIKALQRKNILSKILMIGGFLGIGACMMADIVPGAIVCAVLMIYGAATTKKNGEAMKSLSGDGILKQVLEGVFDDMAYEPFGFLDESQVDSAGFDFGYNKMEGNDYVCGKYKGLNIEMSGITLTSVSHSDGHDHENSVFRGLWMICDFERGFKANVGIGERSALGKLAGKSGIKTEDEDFNKQFETESDNEASAIEFLSPKLMEFIKKTDAKSKKRTYICFLKSGKLHIGFDYGKAAFSVKGRVSDVSAIREQFDNEIHQLTDVIDEISAMDELFM